MKLELVFKNGQTIKVEDVNEVWGVTNHCFEPTSPLLIVNKNDVNTYWAYFLGSEES